MIRHAFEQRAAAYHGGQRRLGEDGGGDVAVVGDGGGPAEQRLGQGRALHQRHRRQVHAIGDIADGIDVVDVSLAVFVDLDGPFFVHLDADLLQAEVLRLCPAACRHHDDVASLLKLTAVLGLALQGERAVVVLHNFRGREVGVHVDPLLLNLLRHKGAALLVESAQGELLPVDEVRLRAVALEDARKLAGDVAPSDDAHLGGELLQRQGLVAGDAVLGAGDARKVRAAAHGNADVLCRVCLAVHINGVPVHQLAAPLDQLHPRILEDVLVDAGQAGDLVGLGLEHGAPV
mmetsp:Transcript_42466/g.108670  ORF Transcript_42466/g.108670 Transcript_42466/m.108670 type:complete len:290 (+) Transcript_42466:663-1532(+)